MRTILNEENLLPLSQPYNSFPWYYNGEENVQAIPSDIVDWILVELISDINSFKIIQSKACFLRNDGFVVDLDSKSKPSFNLAAGSYYIIIKHRNHLNIMSANPVYLSSNAAENYDFTTSREMAYSNGLVSLDEGIFGMFAGDADANGIINESDIEAVKNNIFKTGYLQEDLDMNGIVTVLDYSKTTINSFQTTQIPPKK